MVEPLIRALEDKDDYVRRGAIEALGQISDPRAVEPLIVALEDESQYVRRGAVEALKQIGDARVVEPLAPFLRDGEQDIRETAADALARIGDKRAIELLIAALKDEEGYVRQSAASALGKTGDRRAVEPLKAILEDEQEDVRWAVSGALKAITGQDFGPTSKEDEVARLEAQKETEVAALVAKLLVTGKVVGYLTSPGEGGDAFDERGRNNEARQIGARLDEMGGFELMREVAYLVRRELPSEARSLESAWGYIGKWRP